MKRLISITSLRDSRKVYFERHVLTPNINCLATLNTVPSFILFTDHFQMIYLVLIINSLRAGSGPMKSRDAACLASTSAVSFPSMLLCPEHIVTGRSC